MSLAGIHRFEQVFDRIVPAGLLIAGLALVFAIVTIGG
jgi:hypothetical protein